MVDRCDVVKECHKQLPQSATREEKDLQRIATQAVVHLFNAVSKHQKDMLGKKEKQKNGK